MKIYDISQKVFGCEVYPGPSLLREIPGLEEEVITRRPAPDTP